MTDENTLRTDSVVEAHGEALHALSAALLANGALESDEVHGSYGRVVNTFKVLDQALAAQPRDDVPPELDAAREDMAMCVAEMSKARGRIEVLSGCNEDRRIAAALGSTCDHLRRRWFDLGTRIDTALAPTTQGTPSIPPVAKGYKRRWYRCERHDASGYKDYVPYSLSNPICIMPCGCDLKERHVVAVEQPDTQGTDNGLAGEIADAWDDLVNVDDRTSPEEYPDMCLITRDELAEFMSRADPKISYWRALAKAALATRTDRKAVLEEAAKVAETTTPEPADIRGENPIGRAIGGTQRAIAQAIRALAEGAGK